MNYSLYRCKILLLSQHIPLTLQSLCLNLSLYLSFLMCTLCLIKGRSTSPSKKMNYSLYRCKILSLSQHIPLTLQSLCLNLSLYLSFLMCTLCLIKGRSTSSDCSFAPLPPEATRSFRVLVISNNFSVV